MTTTTTPLFLAGMGAPTAAETRSAALLRRWAIAVLVPVAIAGAVLSFDGLHDRAQVVFGDPLAYAFPALVDLLILGSTLAYLAGAKVGRPRAGWRLAAHAGIAATIALNAAAAPSWVEVPWHITAPIVWSILVELTGHELLGDWKAAHTPAQAHIPVRLWVTAPLESSRTWLRIARRLDGEQAAARLDVGVHAAASHALTYALPGWRNRGVRRILRRQLRAGSLPPTAILAPLGWTDDTAATLTVITGPAVLRAALREAINRAAAESPDRQAPPVPPTPGPDTGRGQPGPAGALQTTATTQEEVIDHTVHTAAPALEGARGGAGLDDTTTDHAEETCEDREPADPTGGGPPATPTASRLDDPATAPIPARAVVPAPAPAEPARAPEAAYRSGSSREPVLMSAAVPDTASVTAPHPTTDSASAGHETGHDVDARVAAAVEILRAEPALSAAALAAALTDVGWQLSRRTASRVRDQARAHLATEPTRLSVVR